MLSSNWCWLPRWDELPQLLWDQGVGSHTHWSQRLPSPGEVVFDPVVMHRWLPGGEHEFWLDAQCVLGNWSWSFCQWSENTGWKGVYSYTGLTDLDDILGHVEQRIHEKCKVHKILICWFWKIVKTFSTNMFVHVSARWVTRPHNTDLQVIFCSIWIWNHIHERMPEALVAEKTASLSPNTGRGWRLRRVVHQVQSCPRQDSTVVVGQGVTALGR